MIIYPALVWIDSEISPNPFDGFSGSVSNKIIYTPSFNIHAKNCSLPPTVAYFPIESKIQDCNVRINFEIDCPPNVYF